MKKNIFTYLFIAYLGMVSSQVWAARMIGTLLSDEEGTSTLVELDSTTGKLIKTFGDTGYKISGVTYDKSTGTLFAITSIEDTTFPSGLLSINLATNEVTPIGLGVGQGVSVTSLTANSSGQLYSWGKTENPTVDKLVLWDKSAGTISAIGDDFGESVSRTGLAFDSSDNLILVAGLSGGPRFFKIDASTGTSTLIGTPEVADSNAHHGSFYPSSTIYYGLDANLDDHDSVRNIVVVFMGENSNSISNSVALIPTEDFLHTLTFIPTEGVGGNGNGECDGTAGISILDIVCVINKVLNN